MPLCIALIAAQAPPAVNTRLARWQRSASSRYSILDIGTDPYSIQRLQPQLAESHCSPLQRLYRSPPHREGPCRICLTRSRSRSGLREGKKLALAEAISADELTLVPAIKQTGQGPSSASGPQDHHTHWKQLCVSIGIACAASDHLEQLADLPSRQRESFVLLDRTTLQCAYRQKGERRKSNQCHASDHHVSHALVSISRRSEQS